MIIKDVESLIITIRNQKVIVDRDLAEIYGVQTRRLNEQVKRNPERFPEDFVFRLTNEEADYWFRSRSQNAILKHGGNINFQSLNPLVFPYLRRRVMRSLKSVGYEKK